MRVHRRDVCRSSRMLCVLIFGLLVIWVNLPVMAGTIVFDADFNASTETGPTVTDNASVSNLDAGTAIGSWALSGSGGGNPGAIIDNVAGGTGSDNAFVFDLGISGSSSDRATGLLSETVDLSAGDSLSFEFDIYASRQGSGRQVRLSLQDSNGAGGGNAYVIPFQINSGASGKTFRWLNTSNGQTVAASSNGVNNGFANASDGNYLSWSTGIGIGVKIDVSGMTTLSDTGGGPPTTGATISIDWDNDGVFDAGDGDVVGVDIGPRTGGISSIDRFELFYGGSSGNRGAYFDNFLAEKSVIPEPASLALVGLGLLASITSWRQRHA